MKQGLGFKIFALFGLLAVELAVSLRKALLRQGLQRFVAETVAPLSEVDAPARTLMKTMLGLALLMLIIVSAVIVYISEKLSKPVRTLRDECELINSGDLTKRPLCLDTTDELGALAHGFSDMRHTMRDLITSITKNAERVSASSEELTAAAQQTAEASTSVATSVVDIAEGISKQSESITTTAATVKEISEQTENVANNASAIAIVMALIAGVLAVLYTLAERKVNE